MEAFYSLDGWVSLMTLTLLEIVLGIDNIIFISLVTSDLKEKEQPLARRLGLGLALLFRVLMLLGITWLIGLTAPLFEIGCTPSQWARFDSFLLVGFSFWQRRVRKW
jgi:predicted tellurium resistance membrane protein TerC